MKRERLTTILATVVAVLGYFTSSTAPAHALGGGECGLCITSCEDAIDPNFACYFSGCGNLGACVPAGSDCDWDIDDADEAIICDDIMN